MPYDVLGNPIAVVTTVDPLFDRVLLRPVEESDRTTGGLFKPDIAREKPQMGDVVAVGPGRLSEAGALVPSVLKAGQRVLYGKYAGTDVDVDGVPHLVMRESDVLAVVSSVEVVWETASDVLRAAA